LSFDGALHDRGPVDVVLETLPMGAPRGLLPLLGVVAFGLLVAFWSPT